MMSKKCLLGTLLITLMMAVQSFAGADLEAVKKRGMLRVGVNGNVLGFGLQDKSGVWRGLDVDVARAVAVALFNDPEKITFSALSLQEGLNALRTDKIDLLTRNVTRTLSREAKLDLDFVSVCYYDGQGFILDRKHKIRNARKLNGLKVCVPRGSTGEQNAIDYFTNNRVNVELLPMEKRAELIQSFFDGKCDVLTSDTSQLAAIRAMSQDPSKYLILPEVISKEPLAPVVRNSDTQFREIVDFSVLAMINAEEMGITSKNVDQMLLSNATDIKRFLGVIAGNGEALGLDEEWAYNIIKKVGNYGEVFSRNLGAKSKLRLERGLNALWINGGLMYSPPFK